METSTSPSSYRMLQEYLTHGKKPSVPELMAELSGTPGSSRLEQALKQHHNQWTLLHYAADRGDTYIIQGLLNQSTEVDKCEALLVQNNIGNTPLALAVIQGHTDTVQHILRSDNATLNYKMLKVENKEEGAILHLAMRSGRLEIVKAIMGSVKEAQALNLLLLQNRYGNIPLSLTAERGYHEIIRYVLSRIDSQTAYLILNIQNQVEGTTVHMAAWNGQTDVFRALQELIITKHAKYDLLMSENKYGNTPLSLAAEKGHLQIVQDILNSVGHERSFKMLKMLNKNDGTPMHTATWNGQTRIVEAILGSIDRSQERVELLLLRNQYGNTPIHLAAERGHLEIIQIMLRELDSSESCRVLKSQSDLGTSLHVAAYNGHSQIIKTILNCIPNKEKIELLFEQNRYSNTPINLAAEQGHLQVIQVILSQVDADTAFEMLQAYHPHSEPTLQIAARNGHTRIIEVILDTVTEDQKYRLLLLENAQSHTAVTLAAYGRHSDSMNCILNKIYGGMRYEMLSRRNSDNEFILHRAAKAGHAEVINVSLKNITEMQRLQLLVLEDNLGHTPAISATWNRNTEVLKVILDALKPANRATILGKQSTTSGGTVLHIAARGRNLDVLETVKSFLSENTLCGLLLIKCAKGLTPLHKSALVGDADFLQQVADQLTLTNWYHIVTAEDNEGDNILLCALAKRHSQMAVFILNSLPSARRLELLCTSNDNGRTPLHIAAYENLLDIFSQVISLTSKDEMTQLLLLKDGDENNVLFEGVSKGNADIVQSILSVTHSENVFQMLSSSIADGKTAIHVAASHGYSSTLSIVFSYLKVQQVQTLLSIPDSTGNSPLAEAAIFGHMNVIQMVFKLLDAELVYEILKMSNVIGQTLLHHSASSGCLKIITGRLKPLLSDDQLTQILSTKDVNGDTAEELDRHLQKSLEKSEGKNQSFSSDTGDGLTSRPHAQNRLSQVSDSAKHSDAYQRNITLPESAKRDDPLKDLKGSNGKDLETRIFKFIDQEDSVSDLLNTQTHGETVKGSESLTLKPDVCKREQSSDLTSGTAGREDFAINTQYTEKEAVMAEPADTSTHTFTAVLWKNPQEETKPALRTGVKNLEEDLQQNIVTPRVTELRNPKSSFYPHRKPEQCDQEVKNLDEDLQQDLEFAEYNETDLKDDKQSLQNIRKASHLKCMAAVQSSFESLSVIKRCRNES
ncbi:serine/threonine-protein phosphatase 6 regulatory ankyrin repeat subunit B-like [Watersipora subatra]|uniref:serine/threonine-protein phosphatase 6 regulatory ankyrin repeat subunit B-like n=1 Tax=Watersipora subatra TaxID=2589382 RepID=UPI00355B5CE1